jgi:hypothetical protein
MLAARRDAARLLPRRGWTRCPCVIFLYRPFQTSWLAAMQSARKYSQCRSLCRGRVGGFGLDWGVSVGPVVADAAVGQAHTSTGALTAAQSPWPRRQSPPWSFLGSHRVHGYIRSGVWSLTWCVATDTASTGCGERRRGERQALRRHATAAFHIGARGCGWARMGYPALIWLHAGPGCTR